MATCTVGWLVGGVNLQISKILPAWIGLAEDFMLMYELDLELKSHIFSVYGKNKLWTQRRWVNEKKVIDHANWPKELSTNCGYALVIRPTLPSFLV